MDLLKGNPKRLYHKYLLPSFASALMISIYSFVDTIAVGQYAGPPGTAAIAVVTPLYGIFTFLAILCGVGGAVLLGKSRGEGNFEKGNAYFTASLILVSVFTLIAWIVFLVFSEPILRFFGADDSLMPEVRAYAKWLIWFLPVFLLPTSLGAFLRNDGAPRLAMAAVIIGGCVNVFGDWFLVFPMDMGLSGAALATLIGNGVQALIMLSHFFRPSCRLRLVLPSCPGAAFRKILSVGIGASVIDFATVFLIILINNQIMRYGTSTDLAVYGVVATIAALFQAMFCGVGQAIQPIVSANFGAGQRERCQQVWKLSLRTALLLGVFFVLVCMLFPTWIVRVFMAVNAEVLAAAPGILRRYSMLFLFQGITVLSTYYLQSIMQNRQSMAVALLRSAALSGALLALLPIALGITGVWIAMPISECLTAVLALYFVYKDRFRKSA